MLELLLLVIIFILSPIVFWVVVGAWVAFVLLDIITASLGWQRYL